jgi:purine-nucleoside phosphorylase
MRIATVASRCITRYPILMLELHDQIEAAAAAIQEKFHETPHAGIILGTGLGGLVEEMEIAATLDYESIPHFPKSTATSHRGRLVCGRLEGVPVVVMEGRFHQYEGYPLKKITLPVRVFKRLGAQLMIVSQAVGGLNTIYRAGDVMIIDDQINLMGDNPLVGINDDRLGPRFPDMSQPYDPELIDAGLEIARKGNFVAHRGVTVAVTGPNLETRAEYRFLRRIGADVVGMSTIPEAIVAVHCGLRTFGLSVITDMCYPDHAEPVNVEQIIATANAAAPKLRALVCGVLTSDATNSGGHKARGRGGEKT